MYRRLEGFPGRGRLLLRGRRRYWGLWRCSSSARLGCPPRSRRLLDALEAGGLLAERYGRVGKRVLRTHVNATSVRIAATWYCKLGYRAVPSGYALLIARRSAKASFTAALAFSISSSDGISGRPAGPPARAPSPPVKGPPMLLPSPASPSSEVWFCAPNSSLGKVSIPASVETRP